MLTVPLDWKEWRLKGLSGGVTRTYPPCCPSLPCPFHGMYSRGLLKHTHSLTAFWGLPFEDIAVIGPRRGSKGEDWRWTAIF